MGIPRVGQGAGARVRIWHLWWIITLFLGSLGQLWAAWICAAICGDANPNSPIGTATALSGVRKKVSLCFRLV